MKLGATASGTGIIQQNAYRASQWPGGRVPFVLDAALGAGTKTAIETAIAEFHAKTCTVWIPRTSEADYVRFFAGAGCYSYIGKVGGAQDVSIGPGCEAFLGVVLHEMSHALGILHEQSRYDRDGFITVNYDHIQAGRENNFAIFDSTIADLLGLAYDYASVMHYGPHAFSKDGEYTITTLDPAAQNAIGQRGGFSLCDVEKLNKLYSCTDQLTDNPICTNTGPVPENCPGFQVDHMYTTSFDRLQLAVNGGGYEMEAELSYCVQGAFCGATLPLYRLHKTFGSSADHLYTSSYATVVSLTKRDWWGNPGWTNEGVECFLWPSA